MTEMPPTPPETDEEAPSEAFAEALAEHEQGGGGAAAAERAAADVEVGKAVKARVVSIGDEHILVDFGGRSEGVVETRGFRAEDGTVKVAPGDELALFVVSTGDQVVLAKSLKADRGAALAAVREAKKAGVPVSGRVTAVNTGGLAVDVSGVRGFCPMSQIESGFCADPKVYIGQTLEFLVTEVKDGRGGVVLSRRQLLRRADEEQGRALLATLKPGDVLEGTVRRLEPFGAFVDLGGIDGLVHVSEIRHDRTHHPKEALKEGERVKVKVLRLDAGKDGKPRLSLSIKAASPDPWSGVAGSFSVGQRVTGKVARLAEFGAFVNLAPGIDGLVHVSEIAPQRIAHPKDVLKAGQEVEAVVLAVDAEKRRVSLSIRQADAPAAPSRAPVVGEVTEAVVARIKPFGVFVDLPAYGPRVDALLPREATGEPRGAELELTFKPGATLKVVVHEVRDGRIRVGLEGVEYVPREPRESPEGRRTGEGGGRGGPGAGRGRPEGRGRGPGGGGGDEGGRRERRPREAGPLRGPMVETVHRSESKSDEPTTMALALRKAMEEARKRGSGGE